MSTEAQINANRQNAKKSSGPRTARGKEVVSQNAVKHGLCAKKNVIRTESQEEFDLFQNEMIEDLAPAGGMELMLAKRIVSLAWRLRRAENFQNLVLDALMDYEMEACHIYLRNARSEAKEGNIELLMGHVINMDFAKSRTLDLLLLYERRIENSLFKITAELRKTQRLRKESGFVTRLRRDKQSQFGEEYRTQNTEDRISQTSSEDNMSGQNLMKPDAEISPASSESSVRTNPASLKVTYGTSYGGINPASLKNYAGTSKADLLGAECGVLGSVYRHLRNKPNMKKNSEYKRQNK